jgi:hypothetical protein
MVQLYSKGVCISNDLEFLMLCKFYYFNATIWLWITFSATKCFSFLISSCLLGFSRHVVQQISRVHVWIASSARLQTDLAKQWYQSKQSNWREIGRRQEREASLTVEPDVELLGLAAPGVEEVEDVLHGAVAFPPLLLLRLVLVPARSIGVARWSDRSRGTSAGETAALGLSEGWDGRVHWRCHSWWATAVTAAAVLADLGSAQRRGDVREGIRMGKRVVSQDP